MKTVIKKEPDTFKAIQWTGGNRADYEVFVTEYRLSKRYYPEYDTEYYHEGNRFIIHKNLYNHVRKYEQIEVPEMSWIVFDYELEVLSNLEFHKKYKILPLK